MKYVFRILVLSVSLAMVSCIINNPKPDECTWIKTTITKITVGHSYDIVFHNPEGHYFYINRGLERGLNLEELNRRILNKSVSLHLAKILGGSVTSEHISQLEANDAIIYSEFKNN